MGDPIGMASPDRLEFGTLDSSILNAHVHNIDGIRPCGRDQSDDGSVAPSRRGPRCARMASVSAAAASRSVNRSRVTDSPDSSRRERL